jgi:RNA polymerase sigma-70 factor (ECF subfamily)
MLKWGIATTVRAEVQPITTHTRADDDAALARSAAHDRQHFMVLYDLYVGSIERYVAARIGSSDVEDLVSATFTRALARIHTYNQERGTFAAWIFTVARNAVVDHYRERARLSSLDPSGSLAAEQPGPEASALSQEEKEWVHAALGTLTADQRDALALRFAGDLSFAAVAQALGKSEPAAKMLVQRGLHSLRRNVEKDQRYD